MKHILVTGAKGQLGQCIKELSIGHDEIKFHFTDVLELDITNHNEVDEYFKKQSFDWCINCAAYTAVDKAESEKEKAMAINATGVKNLALMSHAHGVKMIHISTDFVFNGQSNIAYLETDTPIPLGTYGKSKLEGENNLKELTSNYFLIRTSWLYSEFANNFMKTMLRLSKKRNELGVVSDQIGSPTYAKDLAAFLMEMIVSDSADFGTYHFSNTGIASWFDFAVSIFELEQIDIKVNPLETADYPTPAQRPTFSVLNTKKIRETFNYNIPYWRDSLKEALKNLE